MNRIYRNHIHAYAESGLTMGRLPAAFRRSKGRCRLDEDVWLTEPLSAALSASSLNELPAELREVVGLGLWGGLPVPADMGRRPEPVQGAEQEAVLTFDSTVGPTLLWTESVSRRFPELLFEHHFHGQDTPESGVVAYRAGLVLGQVRLPESAVRLQRLADASADPHRHDREIDDLVQALMDWPESSCDRGQATGSR